VCPTPAGKPLRIVVVYNGGSGVSLFDSTGRQLWNESDGDVWHVAIVPGSRTHRAMIMHSNASGQLTIRDLSGRVLERKPLRFYLYSFCYAPEGRSPGSGYLVAADNGQVWLVGAALDGGQDALPSPATTQYDQVAATFGRFVPGQRGRVALAFVTHPLTAGRSPAGSIISVYDGRSVEQESVPEVCQAVLALPEGPADRLLVGGQGRIVSVDLAHR
jgi:hypothetical protein